MSNATILPETDSATSGLLAPAGHTGHLSGLTGLRGVAAWWVVLFHFNEYLPPAMPEWIRKVVGSGYLAVDLFFILSGFILAFNYLADFHFLNRQAYIRFQGVRLARVYPLHLFMLTVFLANPVAIMLAASQRIDTTRYSPIYFLLSLILVQNWGFSDHLAWNIPAWSISTEWFAYLCFPLIGRVANLVPRRGSMLLLGAMLPLVALATAISLSGDTLGGDIPSAGLPRCILEFTAGVFLYRLWRQCGRSVAVGLASTGLAVTCLMLYANTDVNDFWLMPLAWASLIFSLATGLNPLNRILSWRLLQIIGEWSYSTYLAHYFIRDWVKFLLIRDGMPDLVALGCYIGATACASVLLHRLIEVPGRRVFRRQVDRLLPQSA